MKKQHWAARIPILFLSVFLWGNGAIGQSADRYVGTVQSVQATAQEIEIRNDSGVTQTVRGIPETLFQRVAPGAKDLNGAQPISLTSVSSGDRVLVALKRGTHDLLRLVIMPAAEIAKRDDADREEWRKRGVAGLVTTVSANEITIQVRSMMPGSPGESIIVAINENTVLRRYAPDSVRFADAKPASLRDISAGDQLRARGTKDASARVSAEEVVFGTFVTKVGTVTAVDPPQRQVTITDIASNQPLIVILADGSHIKRMQEMPMGGPGAPGGGPPSASAGGPTPAMAGGHPPDMSQILDILPAGTLEDVRPGETIIVSATKGAAADRVTAITLVANAGMLVRMASMFSGNGASPTGRAPGGMNGAMTGMPNGFSLEGMQIPGMMQ